MKMLLAMISLLLGTQAFAGPSISGGIIYHEELEACKNTKAKSELYVRAVMNPENIMGVLVEGKNSTNLKCNELNKRSTAGEIIYVCNEERPGEGQLKATIIRNSQGVKYAQVSRKDIIQRDQVMYTMACDQQVSH